MTIYDMSCVTANGRFFNEDFGQELKTAIRHPTKSI